MYRIKSPMPTGSLASTSAPSSVRYGQVLHQIIGGCLQLIPCGNIKTRSFGCDDFGAVAFRLDLPPNMNNKRLAKRVHFDFFMAAETARCFFNFAKGCSPRSEGGAYIGLTWTAACKHGLYYSPIRDQPRC
jgi:hypothetical protein